MTKKILAVFMLLMISISLFFVVPCASAEEDMPDITADYVPGEITGNIISGSGNMGYGEATYNYNYCKEGLTTFTTSGDANYFKSSSSGVSNPLIVDGNAYYHNPVVGFNIATAAPAEATGRVVFSFNVRTPQGTGLVNIGRRNTSISSTSDSARVEYPIEYNGYDKGFGSSTNYAVYTGTFKDTGAASGKYQYAFGFVVGTGALAVTWFKPADSYIGYEYAYDISVSADSTHLPEGGTLTADADILNQIGNVGEFDQNVNWYVTNRDRTQLIPGFNFSEGSDGTVSLTAEKTVLTGEYTLIAVYDNDKKLVKGIDITVEGKDLTDYVPGEVTGNTALVVNENGGELLSANYTPFDITYVGTVNAGTDNEAWTLTTIEDTPGEGILGANGLGAAGASFRKSCYGADELFVVGKNIVIGAKVRAQRGTPTVQAAMYQYGKEPIFPVEYPEGKKLTDSQWQDFTATFHIPESGWMGARNTHFYIGYGYTGLVDECERVLAFKKNSIYIGEEYAYDLEVTSDIKKVTPGKTTMFTVNSRVINQVGSTGYLNQDVTWYAVNHDRTAYADGITLAEGSNGAVTVTVSDTVPEGKYCIVATSDTYDGLQKGITISVKNPYEDYIPGEVAGNWINCDVSEVDVLYPTWQPADFTSVGTIDDGTDDEAWTIKSKLNVEESILGINSLGVGGAGISRDYFDAATNLSSGKKIAIGAKVKATNGTPIIKTSMYHLQSTPIFPIEYTNASDGFPVSGSEWQDFGATLQIPESGWRGYEHTLLYLGFVYTGKLYDGNRGFAVKKNSFYIGEEYAYDIVVTSDKSEWTEGETESITLSAKVINQVGTVGYLNQNVTWHALDKTRKYKVPGISITEKTDGTAVVEIADYVPSGTYDIVVVSDGYEEFAKGVSIEVIAGEEPSERVALFDLKESNGTATLNAAVDDTDSEAIFFALASYDENGEMVKVEFKYAVNEDGVAVVDALTLTGVTSGQTIRGYAWDNRTLRPIEFGEGIENTIIIKN